MTVTLGLDPGKESSNRLFFPTEDEYGQSEELTEAINRGWGERDSRVAMLLQEERAGVEIKVPDAALKAVLDAEKTK